PMVAQFGSPQGKGVKSSNRNLPWDCSTEARMMSAVFSRVWGIASGVWGLGSGVWGPASGVRGIASGGSGLHALPPLPGPSVPETRDPRLQTLSAILPLENTG